MKQLQQLTLAFILMAGFLSGCEEFLDAKPDKSLVVPNSLSDLENLLDNVVQLMNQDPALGTISGDEISISSLGWAGISNPVERNAYLWREEIYEGRNIADWNFPFQQIFYSNVVLEELERFGVEKKSTSEWKSLKGHAHFKRSMAYYQLSQIFIPPYNSAQDNPNGLPLRKVSSVTDNPPRATVWQTYDFIIADLVEALKWLPNEEAIQTRPTLNAAKALLARIYLLQSNYQKSLQMASEVIQNADGLLHYADLNGNLAVPFPVAGNKEILYWSRMVSYGSLNSSLNSINPEILNLFSENDLRTQLFFVKRPTGSVNFRGSYTGNFSYFSGISLNEIYLISAECNAYLNNIEASLAILNDLLSHRWKKGMYEPIGLSESKELLKIIFRERKKELMMRGLRWSDIRRLNLQPDFQQTLYKTIDGVKHSLTPNNLRFTLPFPEIEIERNGFKQNPR